jgi:hypothetical protein
MNSKTLLDRTLRNENTIRRENVKNFSWVLFFAGEEFNQELAKNNEVLASNTIDFEKESVREGVWIEKRIKEICSTDENKELIEEKKFPVIWFKNIEKIVNGSEIEKALLPIFDHQQNTDLFGEKISLKDYILVATSSTRDMGKLSPPLTSRLECINVETAQPQQFFLDKYFNFLLGGTVFFVASLLAYLFWPKRSKEIEIKE